VATDQGRGKVLQGEEGYVAARLAAARQHCGDRFNGRLLNDLPTFPEAAV
jgi:hypothetical protein